MHDQRIEADDILVHRGPLRHILSVAIVIQFLVWIRWGFPYTGGDVPFYYPLVPGLGPTAYVIIGLSVWLLPLAAALVLTKNWLTLGAGLWATITAAVLARNTFDFHHDILLSAVVAIAIACAANRRQPFLSGFGTWALLGVGPLVYISAGIQKINPVFLSGEVVAETAESLGLIGSGLRAIGVGSDTIGGELSMELAKTLAYLTVAGEVGVGALVVFKKTRRLALVAALLLHSGILLMTGRGLVFNLLLVATLIPWLFLSGWEPRYNFVSRMLGPTIFLFGGVVLLIMLALMAAILGGIIS